MSVVQYLTGVAFLLAVVAPLAWASRRLRARLLPGWTGLLARLAELIGVVGAALVVCEALGAVGLFRAVPVALTCFTAGVAAGLLAGRPPGTAVARPPERGPAAIAVGIGAFLIAEASSAGFLAFRNGPFDVDTRYYHLPLAARFVQEGWLTRIHFFRPGDPAPYHPANAELVHALGILAFHRDFASLVVNLGWLLVALAAAWCIGLPYRASPACVAGAAVILATPIIATTQVGAATNDVASLALWLAAVALVVNAGTSPAAHGYAGLAAGLGVGTKLTLLVPVGGLAVVAIARSGRRWLRTSAVWAVSSLAGGGYWYLRNLARVGSPLPAIHIGLGGFTLPHPYMEVIDRYGFSVMDYATNVRVWRRYFLPGLSLSFGPGWPLLITLACVSAVLAVLIAKDGLSRGLGITAIAGLAAYLVTPSSALGFPGKPDLFYANLRYATPGLAVGLILIPLLTARTRPGVALPLLLVPIPLVALSRVPWTNPPLAALVAGAGLVLGIAAVVMFDRVIASRRVLLACVVGVAACSLAAGYVAADRYSHRRYATPYTTSDRGALWARDVHGARIGYAGFVQSYPLYGLDLSNRVEYVGRHRRDGAFVDIDSCAGWRAAINRGRYGFVVVTPEQATEQQPVFGGWTRDDPGASEVIRDGEASVFRITRPLDPSGCRG